MKRTYAIAISGVMILALTVMLSRGGSAQGTGVGNPLPQHPAATIGAATTDLTGDYLLAETWMRAFIRTDSASEKCLVTLRESNVADNVSSAFCAHRVMDGQDGILVTVFFHWAPVPPDAAIGLTIYQEQAKQYAAPVVYLGD